MSKTVMINGTLLSVFCEPSDVVSLCVESVLRKDLVCWSDLALSELYFGILEFTGNALLSIAEEHNQTSPHRKQHKQRAARIFKQLDNSRRYVAVKGLPEGQQIIQKMYDLMLTQSGLSNLAGFGTTNSYGDSPKGNSEKSLLSRAVIFS